MKNSTAKGLQPRSGPQGVVGKRKSTVDAGTDAAGKASETNKKPRVLRPITTSAPPEGSDGVIITPVALTEKVDDDLSFSEKVDFIMGVMLAKDLHMKKLECNNEGLSADKQKLETRVRELEVTNKKLGEDLRQAASDLTLSKADMQKHIDLVYKSLDDLSVKHESLKMSESMLRTQVGVSESLKSQLLSQVEDLGAEKSVLVSQVEAMGAEKSVLVSQVEALGAEKSVLVSQVEKLEAEKSVLVSQVEELEAEKSSTLWWDLDTDNTEKYKKYEADYVRRIKAKYFSKKNLYGGNIFENKTTIEDEVIKSSRWPSTRSYTDPVQSFEDHSRSSSTSAAEISANLSSRKYQSKKSSS